MDQPPPPLQAEDIVRVAAEQPIRMAAVTPPHAVEPAKAVTLPSAAPSYVVPLSYDPRAWRIEPAPQPRAAIAAKA
jgi:hypothetical protein